MGKTVKLLCVSAFVAAMCGGIVVATNKNRCDRVRRFFTGESNILVYSSQDGRCRVIGPIWDCARRVDGRLRYPVVVNCGESDGRVYWCHETSRGSSGNFKVESEAGDFSLYDNSYCHSDEATCLMQMTVVSGGTTNCVELVRRQ